MDLESKIQFAFLLGLLAGVILSGIVTAHVLKRQHVRQMDRLSNEISKRSALAFLHSAPPCKRTVRPIHTPLFGRGK